VEYDESFEAIYTLRMPNYEVERAFHMQVLSSLSNSGDLEADQFRVGMGNALSNGNLDEALALVKSLFASIPYHIHVPLEAYYHSVFYAALNVLGFDIQAEVATSRGRVDAVPVLELGGAAYIFDSNMRAARKARARKTKPRYTPQASRKPWARSRPKATSKSSLAGARGYSLSHSLSWAGTISIWKQKCCELGKAGKKLLSKKK